MNFVQAEKSHKPTSDYWAERSSHTYPKYFPFFMIGISFIQIVLTYQVNNIILHLLFSYDPQRRYEFWRFLTILLVHAGPIHLWSNVIFQLMLGVILEIDHNWMRIAIIYLSSVLGGSLLITVLSPQVYAAGASAGVYGLLFSHLSMILLNWSSMDRKHLRLLWLALYIALDLGSTVYIVFFRKLHLPISYAGHIGGAITGFVVSFLALKKFENHKWQDVVQKICGVILVAFCIIIFLVNVSVSSLYLPTEWNSNYMRSYKNYATKFDESSRESLTVSKDIRLVVRIVEEAKT